MNGEQEVQTVNSVCLFPAGPANEENFFEWEALIMWVKLQLMNEAAV